MVKRVTKKYPFSTFLAIIFHNMVNHNDVRRQFTIEVENGKVNSDNLYKLLNCLILKGVIF